MADLAESAPTRRSVGWRVLRVLAIVASSLVTLVMLAALALALFGERWANDFAQKTAADLERELGRPIALGPASLSALRGAVEVQDVLIGPAAGEPDKAAALRLGRASLNIGMLRTLLSLGFYPYVEEVALSDLQVHVVERADGSLNWEAITASDSPPAPDDDAELDARVKNARLGELIVRRASIVLVDAGRPQQTARIDQLDLTLRDVGYRVGLTLDLAAAVLAPAQNLTAHAEIGPLDEGALPPVEALRIAMKPTQLASLAPMLGALADSSSMPERGVLSIDVAVSAKEADKAVAKGTLQLADAVLPGGKPFDAQLRFDGASDRDADTVSLQSAELRLGEMQLSARAQLEDLDEVPALRSMEIRSQGLSFDAIRAIYPGFDALSDPARLDGPFTIAARGGGDARSQAADLELALTDARITVPDALDKPPGTPLFLKAHLQGQGDTLTLAPLRLQVADFALMVEGKLEELDSDQPRVALQLSTPNRQVSSLLRLLPPIARAKTPDDALRGELSVDGKLQGTGERYEGEATLALSSLQVDVPSARFEGGGTAKLSVRDAGAGSEGSLKVDFTQLTALYADVLRKPGGTAARIDAALTTQGTQSDLTLSTTLASLVMNAKATLRGEAPSRAFSASLEIPSCRLRGLARLLPGIEASQLGDIQLTAKAKAEGVTDEPASMRVEIPSFTLRAGSSDLRGSLSARNPVRPRVELTARSNFFALEDFLPSSEKAREKPAEPKKRSDEPAMLANASGRIDLEAQRGRVAQVSFEKLRAILALEDGRARAERLEVGVFGGAFHGTGSELPLVASRGDYVLRGDLQGIEVASALEQLADTRELLRGKVSAKVDVTTPDLTPRALRQGLTGLVRANMAEGAFLPGHGFTALTGQLGQAAEIPGLKRSLEQTRARIGAEEGNTWTLKDLAAALRFDRGAAVLEQPLTFRTPQGDIRLEGKVGLTSASDMNGTFALTPGALSALTQGKVSFTDAVPVPFRVQGPLTRPALSFGDLGGVLQPLVSAFVREEGERQLTKGAEQVLDKADLGDKADAVRRRLERSLGRRKAQEGAP